MYAVFMSGSRQYRVTVGDVVKVDFRDSDVGSEVVFDHVLLVADGSDVKIGQPIVAGASVVATVLDHPTIKTRIQKFRRRKNYKRLRGHTQPYTRVKVTAVK